ncbi:ABC transporter permease [Microbacterium sp. 18062]|uniref:ABC transporter permease n=1 Tax=Microbacterium sp. 18062 TaxID=2681410 RepID=UPI001358191D|nr:ABC transporter permease [Microbacterium sp. 18062]
MNAVVRRALSVLEQIWLPILLIAIWWVASEGSTSLYFPPLSKIWATTIELFANGQMIVYIGVSLGNIVAGLLIASVLGVVVGVTIGRMETLRQMVDPLLQFFRAVPQTALIPILIGALGVGIAPKIFMIAFACFWPILLNTIDGVRSIDPQAEDMSRAYRIPLWLRIRGIILPAAMAQIIAGVRVALAISVVVMVVSEFFASTTGIGYFIQRSSNAFAFADVWSGAIVIGVLGYLLSELFRLYERITLRWYFDSAALAEEGGVRGGRTLRRRLSDLTGSIGTLKVRTKQ